VSGKPYSDYAKDRNGWFFGLSGAQLALVVLAGVPELAAINRHDWLLMLGWLPIWALLIAGMLGTAVLVGLRLRGRRDTESPE